MLSEEPRYGPKLSKVGGFTMRDKKVTGVGCFAKPATLSRVFKKMVRNYTLGQFESINLVNDHDAVKGADGTALLRTLMAGKAGYFPSPNSESCVVVENRKITGFFLTLRNQRLNLSIFARGDRNVRERYTARLDAFTELRHKRLN
jgi:hypothetical protein